VGFSYIQEGFVAFVINNHKNRVNRKKAGAFFVLPIELLIAQTPPTPCQKNAFFSRPWPCSKIDLNLDVLRIPKV